MTAVNFEKFICKQKFKSMIGLSLLIKFKLSYEIKRTKFNYTNKFFDYFILI